MIRRGFFHDMGNLRMPETPDPIKLCAATDTFGNCVVLCAPPLSLPFLKIVTIMFSFCRSVCRGAVLLTCLFLTIGGVGRRARPLPESIRA